MYFNPYNNFQKGNGQWLKANLHTHTGIEKCDRGVYEIDEMIAVYKEAGYDVLTISNHDIFSDVKDYRTKYDMVLINGFEYSKDLHMLCYDVNGLIDGKHQEIINECAGQGGFSVISHPNAFTEKYWPWEKLDFLKGYIGIEVYNALSFKSNGTGLATDTWDYLLSQGKLVWGFGSDDSHRWYDIARGWNMIYSNEKKHEAVKESILNGGFYVSTGLELKEFVYSDNIIRVKASVMDTYDNYYRYLFIGKDGEVLGECEGEAGEYHLTGNELYIRTQVISRYGAMLWTQPVYKEEVFKRP